MLVRRLMIGAVAAMAVTGAVGAGTVSAHGTREKPTFAQVIGPVIREHGDPRAAHVLAVYRCNGEGALWLSVKQTADRKADPRLAEEGSSAIAAAWSDSHRNAVDCDGRVHVGKFSVDQEEPYFTENGPAGKKSDIYEPLARGVGYVQFCLFDDQHVDEPLSVNSFRAVL
jgi:hypothetical protein